MIKTKPQQSTVRKVLNGVKTGVVYGLKGGGVILIGAFFIATSPFWIPSVIWDHYHEDSEKNLKRWIRKDPANPDLHLRLGRIHRNQYKTILERSESKRAVDLENAVAEFERTIFLDGDCVEAYYALYRLTKDPKKKFNYLRKAVKANPDLKYDSCTIREHLWDLVHDATKSKDAADRVVSATLGTEYRREGNLEEKLAEFESAVEEFEKKLVDSPNSELLIEYARFLRENYNSGFLDREGFVRDKLQELISRDPRNSALYYEHGKFAETTMRDSFALLPPDEWSGTNFAIAYEDPDFNVNDWKFYCEIAEHYLHREDFGKAAIALERGIKACFKKGDNAFEALKLLETDFDGALKLLGVNGHEATYQETKLDLSWVKDSDKLKVFGQILYAQAVARGKEYSHRISPEIIMTKARTIRQLGNQATEDMAKFREWLGAKEGDKAPEVNRYQLAKDLNSLGLYDEAIEVLESIEEKGKDGYQLLADSYECKWRREGKKEFLKRVHLECYEAVKCTDFKDMDSLVKIAFAVRYRGMDNVVKNMLHEAQGLAEKAAPGVYDRQLKEMWRHAGENEYLKGRMAEADSETDPEKRAVILTEVAQEAPLSFVVEHGVKSKLAEAYGEYAPIVKDRLKKTAASLAKLVQI
jgi:tetratricopeptide (TPR) repeat protein